MYSFETHYEVAYFSKNGGGFTKNIPWLIDCGGDLSFAHQKRDELVHEGFKDVHIIQRNYSVIE